MANILSLADFTKNGALWSPRQMLDAFDADMEAGKIGTVTKMAVHFWEELPDGSLSHRCYQAGMAISEEVALLEVAKLEAIERWQR